jgi:tetratricopeptide (TPR) repeat protein
MDVGAAVDELIRSSFVESKTAADDTVFLDVALVAAVFGQRKLETTPMRAAIDADVEFLRQIGATTTTALRYGVQPRIKSLFQNIAARLSLGKLELDAVAPSLELICRQYPLAWLMLAKLHEEAGRPEGLTHAAECLRRFLETPQSSENQRLAWDELGRIYWQTGDWSGAAQAYIRVCKLPDTPYSVLSNTANRLNNLFREYDLPIDSDEKRLLYRELTQLMERRKEEADATDLSRLAWVYLHLHDPVRAREIVEEGLDLDADNEHCNRLLLKLRGSVGRAEDVAGWLI